MDLKFVTEKLNAAYALKGSVSREIRNAVQLVEQYETLIQRLKNERALNDLDIRKLEVLLKQPAGVKIEGVDYSGYTAKEAAERYQRMAQQLFSGIGGEAAQCTVPTPAPPPAPVKKSPSKKKTPTKRKK